MRHHCANATSNLHLAQLGQHKAQAQSSVGLESQQVSWCVGGEARKWPDSSWVQWFHTMGREVALWLPPSKGTLV